VTSLIEKSDSKRIVFLDILRAIAVIMMIQGHTVHVLLGEKYRSFEFPLYNLWFTIRGFTAPIFLFVAGITFTYLLFKGKNISSENKMVNYGLKRALMLLSLGYLLRYPTHRIYDLWNVSAEQWKIFLSVDVLHLISFGLLIIILIYMVSQKFNINFSITALFAAIISFIAVIFLNKIELLNYFPLPIANYVTDKYGSLFPLTPWLGYLLLGSCLGAVIGVNPKIFHKVSFSLILLLLGVVLYGISKTDFMYNFFPSEINLIMFRLGVVFSISSIVILISRKIKNVPFLIKLLGRHSLVIYIVHIIILYGCAWFPGIWKYFKFSLSFEATMISVFMMIILMLKLAYYVEINKIGKRKLIYKVFIDK